MNKTIENAKRYVGGHWNEIGQKVFKLLKEEGLKPEHILLDIGMGSGRCAVKLMPYLDKYNYYGIEKHDWLIDAFYAEEPDLRKTFPTIFHNDSFNFNYIDKKIDFAIAKSVFTHLTKPKIKQCLDNLKEVIAKDGKFYASIFIGDSSKNPKEDHDNKRFNYSIEEIQELAEGWNIKNLGNRGCKRQTMLFFTLCQ